MARNKSELVDLVGYLRPRLLIGSLPLGLILFVPEFSHSKSLARGDQRELNVLTKMVRQRSSSVYWLLVDCAAEAKATE